MSRLNPVAREPVAVQAMAGILAALAAKYAPGLHLSDAQALWVALGAYTLLAPFARQLVRPVAKDDDPVPTPVTDEMVRATITKNQSAPTQVPPPPDPGKVRSVP